MLHQQQYDKEKGRFCSLTKSCTYYYCCFFYSRL